MEIFLKRSGGYRSEVNETPVCSTGETADGAEPGGHSGMCLLGMDVGVRGRTLRLRAGETGGGVAECRIDCCWTRTVAIADMLRGAAFLYSSALCRSPRMRVSQSFDKINGIASST